MKQRIEDFLRELRIKRLGREIEAHMWAGNAKAAREAMEAMRAEIKARSPVQVDRMERERGLA